MKNRIRIFKKKGLQPLVEIRKLYLSKFFRKKDFSFIQSLNSVWEEVIPYDFAKQALIIDIKKYGGGKILTICSKIGLIPFFHFYKEDILNRLNRFFGKKMFLKMSFCMNNHVD